MYWRGGRSRSVEATGEKLIAINGRTQKSDRCISGQVGGRGVPSTSALEGRRFTEVAVSKEPGPLGPGEERR